MTKLQKYLVNGLIFEYDGKLTRKCPTCSKLISNDNKRAAEILINGINDDCRGCAQHKCGPIKSLRMKGENNPFFGKKHSDELINQIRSKKIGSKHSDETKRKMSDAHSGEKHPMYGKHHSEETKRKLRQIKLEQLERNGVPTNVDKGAPEWFEKYNRENGLNLRPKRFWELGYDADGYDSEKHIWIEYDTPYHNKPSQTKKDLVRQNNIIKYFEDIGRPLKDFVRVNSETLEVFRI